MKLDHTVYETALEIFQQAVAAFCGGDLARGDELLATLNLDAIEKDRVQLRDYATTARPLQKIVPSNSVSRTVPAGIKAGVQRRDRYHCRFTGRRLIDTRVFHEVSRISSVFHFDEHHSVNETTRGPAGHPMVRTHAAAYEHAVPLVCGGTTSIDNIVHTSVQLNESKGALVLDQVPVPDDDWNGLVETLTMLRFQPSAGISHKGHTPSAAATRVRPPNSRQSDRTPRGLSATAYRQAAEGLDVDIFALSEDPDAERKMKLLRRTNENWFFTTKPNNGKWRIHRVYCSALDFNGEQKVTLKPKVCAEQRTVLETWAKRFGVETESCKRCPTPR